MSSDALFDVVCEDGPLLAVSKPAGLPTQAPPGIPSLESAVKAHLKERYQKPGNVYLGVPHRLDRPVSGLVVFARNSKAAARLAEQFAERRVKKVYRAIVEGHWPDDAGTLTDRLTKIPDEARVAIATADEADAREAVLSYRVLARGTLADPAINATLIDIEPETGRMHQIRIQFASRGFPIVGDARYGATSRWDNARSGWDPGTAAPPDDDQTLDDAIADADRPGDRIALHALQLTLFHPIRYDVVTLSAPLPSHWPALTSDA